MKILISQPFGCGDVIYSMQLARIWIEQGHSITWPVFPQFVSQLQRAYPFITFVDWQTIPAPYDCRDEIDWNGYRYIPLRWANEIMGQPYDRCMANKFELFNLPFSDWRKGAMWERDGLKERRLSLAFGASTNIVVNRTYGSDGKMRVNVPYNDGDILMVPSAEYSLFDWAAVLENATEIHTVSTSIIYPLEMLDITCPIHLYARPTDPKFSQVSYLFTKPYILHAG